MARVKPSFGYERILADRPDLKFDLEQLPTDLIKNGELDQIAVELEVMGSGSSIKIRTDALRRIGERLIKQKLPANHALRWLSESDRAMSVWAACACAREALKYVPSKEQRPLRAIEAVEGWVSNAVSLDRARDAIASLYSISTVNDSYVWAVRSAASVFMFAQNNSLGDNAAAYAANAVAFDLRRPYQSREWVASYEAELQGLVDVIAEALPGMPVRVR